MVSTILLASAQSCSSLKAMTRTGPVLAEVIFKWTKSPGNRAKGGGVCTASNGQMVLLKRHACNTEKINSEVMPFGKTIGSLGRSQDSATFASCANVQESPLATSCKAISFLKSCATCRQRS